MKRMREQGEEEKRKDEREWGKEKEMGGWFVHKGGDGGGMRPREVTRFWG